MVRQSARQAQVENYFTMGLPPPTHTHGTGHGVGHGLAHGFACFARAAASPSLPYGLASMQLHSPCFGGRLAD